jgi:hypothetical protein
MAGETDCLTCEKQPDRPVGASASAEGPAAALPADAPPDGINL